ncbi:MAG TPA: hypothetical protein VFK26_15210 [Gemmatimonadaceae bacterium]|jgi:hypothetical protein|nr:hypothetical protein [Gemmatimonadaceae bacterium]
MPKRRQQNRSIPQRLGPWLALAVAAGTLLTQLATLFKLVYGIVRP